MAVNIFILVLPSSPFNPCERGDRAQHQAVGKTRFQPSATEPPEAPVTPASKAKKKARLLDGLAEAPRWSGPQALPSPQLSVELDKDGEGTVPRLFPLLPRKKPE